MRPEYPVPLQRKQLLSFFPVNGFLAWLWEQRRRTSLCETITVSVSANKSREIPRFSKRWIAVTAPLLWSVEWTKCRLREAFTAMLAISSSLISPIKMTSGSWRKAARNVSANPNPCSGLTETCVIPSIWYSTGFSIVRIFIYCELSALRIT